jgi:phosphoribosylformylglycinamidine cyclo-ligase
VSESSYKAAGVDIDAKYAAVAAAKQAIRTTFTSGVVSDIGLFGGLFDAARVGAGDQLLVASTDGVGTKVLVAAEAERYDSIGHDIVNHSINDVLVQGARPLFFLDYVGTGKLDPAVVTQILQGMAAACQVGKCALLGGETAEMPGLYHDGHFEIVGTIVGAVARDRVLDGSKVRDGDAVLSLPSNGLHTNGYSLARRVLFEQQGFGLDDSPHGLGVSLVDALLAPHRSYLEPVLPLLEKGSSVHACAHITGGGVLDNLPRVLPAGLGAELRKDSVEVPDILRLITELGQVDDSEAYRVFNMGFGFLLVVDPTEVDTVLASLRAAGEDAREVGRITGDLDGVCVV